MFYEIEEAENILRFYRDYIKDAPEEMGAFPAFQIAPPLPFIPEDRHGDMFAAIVACWSGDPEEGERQFKAFHDVAEVKAELVGPVPYPAINAAFDGLFPTGIGADRRSHRRACRTRAERPDRKLDDASLSHQRGVSPGRRGRHGVWAS
jgi:hypothetical protein